MTEDFSFIYTIWAQASWDTAYRKHIMRRDITLSGDTASTETKAVTVLSRPALLISGAPGTTMLETDFRRQSSCLR